MRMRIVFGVVALFWIMLLGRIYHLSINSNTYYNEIAEQNAIKTIYIPPVRGIIFDAHDDTRRSIDLGFSIYVKPHLSTSKKVKILDDELAYIGSLFSDLNVTKLKNEYIKNDSAYNQDFISVVEFIDYDKFCLFLRRFRYVKI